MSQFVDPTAAVAQLAGLDANRLIEMIVKAVERSRMHKKRCKEILEYVRLIGDLLQRLDISRLKMRRETGEPLKRLEKALLKYYILVDNYQGQGFFYVLTMSWNVEQQLKNVEFEIERYMNLIPLITLVELQAITERRESIRRDQPEHIPEENDNNLHDGPCGSGVGRLREQRGRTSIAYDAFAFFRKKRDALAAAFIFQNECREEEENGVDHDHAICSVFTLEVLRSATGGFADGNIVGFGKFTVIYKGILDGTAIAVKKWNLDLGPPEWENEINILRTHLHGNVIKLLGWCKEEDEVLLVYEFMDNRSLGYYLLHDGLSMAGAEPLTWEKRIKIAIGIARALEILHENNIIHMGLKPSVILLDSDFNTKLSGLGQSRVAPVVGGGHLPTQIWVTRGYFDPQYIMTGHADAKTDVYAFGLVLLQILTGQKVFDMGRASHERHLIQLVDFTLEEGDRRRISRLMDPRLPKQYPFSRTDFRRLVELALSCTSFERENRPIMKEIIKFLEQIEN